MIEACACFWRAAKNEGAHAPFGSFSTFIDFRFLRTRRTAAAATSTSPRNTTRPRRRAARNPISRFHIARGGGAAGWLSLFPDSVSLSRSFRAESPRVRAIFRRFHLPKARVWRIQCVRPIDRAESLIFFVLSSFQIATGWSSSIVEYLFEGVSSWREWWSVDERSVGPSAKILVN